MQMLHQDSSSDNMIYVKTSLLNKKEHIIEDSKISDKDNIKAAEAKY